MSREITTTETGAIQYIKDPIRKRLLPMAATWKGRAVDILGVRIESDYSKQVMYMIRLNGDLVWIYYYETEIP
jgi:hypothetical protein